MALKQNIIYIYFKGKHLVTSKSQYQYNHGQFLYFADLDLPQAFEVHFSNRDKGESKTQIGSDKLVEIPDEYFWNGALQIYAWIYLHNQANDGETVYEVKIPLIKRAKPTDEEPLPVQQSTIDRVIAELNNAVDITNENADKTNADKTQVATIKEEVVTLKEEIDSTASAVSQDAKTAKAAAERSEQSAQNSAEFENNAHNYADEAKGYAQSALESKNTASQKAQVASDASAEAKDFRNEAETFKNEAEQAKQNIVDYRNETKGYRDEALTAKNDAQDSADAAQKSYEDITEYGNQAIRELERIQIYVNDEADSARTSANVATEKADSIKNLTALARTLPEGSSASASYDAQTGVMTFGIPKGADGKDGTDGKDGVDGGGMVVTATHVNGMQYTIDSTYDDIKTALSQGKTVVMVDKDDEYHTIHPYIGNGYIDDGWFLGFGISATFDGKAVLVGFMIPEYYPTIAMRIDQVTPIPNFTDVQINGASIVENSVVNIPIASDNKLGVVKTNSSYGISSLPNGILQISASTQESTKEGTDFYGSIVPANQHAATFYGLAKAAGHDEKNSTLPVGQYTPEAQTAIRTMLGLEDVYQDYSSALTALGVI